MGISGYSPHNRDITISENTIEDTGVINAMGHALHWAGSNVVIAKNTARNISISGIVISGWPNSNPTPVEGFEITDNVVDNILSDGNNAKGVLVQNASSGRISGNRISRTKACPIEADGNSLGHGGPRIYRIKITGNLIAHSPPMGNVAGQTGICLSQADDITVSGNSFTR